MNRQDTPIEVTESRRLLRKLQRYQRSAHAMENTYRGGAQDLNDRRREHTEAKKALRDEIAAQKRAAYQRGKTFGFSAGYAAAIQDERARTGGGR